MSESVAPSPMLDTRPPDTNPAAALPLNPRDGLATVITGDYASVTSLVSGSLTRTVATVAIPAVASTLLMTLFATVDAFWVGTRIGPRGLAAVSTSIFWVWMLVSCAEMVSVGLTAVASRRHGERRHDAAARAVGDAIVFAVALASVLGVTGILRLDALFGIMHTPPEVTALGERYLGTYLLGAPLIFGFFAVDAAFRAAGDTRTPFLLLLGCVLTALALDPVLILGLGPAPRLGIAGSATATLIANYAAFFGLIGYIYIKDLPLRLRGRELRYLWCDLAIMKTILVKGFPMGLQMIIISLSALALVGLVNREGVDTTAAFGVAMQLWTYVQMPAMALGAAVSAMAAQNIGAGRWDRVGRITRIGIVQTVIITAVMIVALTLADRAVLALFMGGDSPALPIAKHIHVVATWNFLLFGVMMVLFGTVRANGAVWIPLIVLAVGMVPVRFGYIFATYGWLGADAIWTSFPVTSFINLALAIGFYVHGGWKKARMTLGEQPCEEETTEEALATREPGGALNPAG